MLLGPRHLQGTPNSVAQIPLQGWTCCWECCQPRTFSSYQLLLGLPQLERLTSFKVRALVGWPTASDWLKRVQRPAFGPVQDNSDRSFWHQGLPSNQPRFCGDCVGAILSCLSLSLSLLWHRCWSLGPLLRNTLHTELHSRVCFLGTQPAATHWHVQQHNQACVISGAWQGHKWMKLVGLNIAGSGGELDELERLCPI